MFRMSEGKAPVDFKRARLFSWTASFNIQDFFAVASSFHVPNPMKHKLSPYTVHASQRFIVLLFAHSGMIYDIEKLPVVHRFAFSASRYNGVTPRSSSTES
jgi:hypothetical protein